MKSERPGSGRPTRGPGPERPAGLTDGRVRNKLANKNIDIEQPNRQTVRVALTA
jgi:hypothetical protein